ncbi:MAG TPA: hypothetical protein VEZ13_18285 [Brevibacillus sp.]|nr:hypothetical protein [Brevibacillus sp.]
MQYRVIADFIDSRTGKIVKAGETVKATEIEYAALLRAGVVGEAVSKNAKVQAQDSSDGGADNQIPGKDVSED